MGLTSVILLDCILVVTYARPFRLLGVRRLGVDRMREMGCYSQLLKMFMVAEETKQL